MSKEELLVRQKAIEVMENVMKFAKENDCHVARAWDAVRDISNLTNDEMVKCALVAFVG